jgi:hypothetical protein
MANFISVLGLRVNWLATVEDGIRAIRPVESIRLEAAFGHIGLTPASSVG